MNYILIFIGGGFGSVCRHLVSSCISQNCAVLFPLGTLSVNVIGSFLIGFLYQAFLTFTVSPELRMVTTIGFLGGFTTFSTFSMESANLLAGGEHTLLGVNVIATNLLGLAASLLGIRACGLLIDLIR